MTILPVTHDDVSDVVRAHIALQHVSYAHAADGGHAAALWGTYDRRVADCTTRWSQNWCWEISSASKPKR